MLRTKIFLKASIHMLINLVKDLLFRKNNKNLSQQSREKSEFYKKQGDSSLSAGNFSEAADYYEQTLAIDKNNVDARFQLGTIRYVQKNYDAASVHFRHILTLRPEHVEARNHLGTTLYAQGNADEAIAFYQQALSFNPEHVDTLLNLAVTCQTVGHIYPAIEIYEKILALTNYHLTAHFSLGLIFHTQKKFDEAISHFRTILARDSANVATLHGLGTALQAKECLDEAQTCYQKALQINPDHTESLINLGLILEKNDIEHAFDCYKKALQINHHSVAAKINMGNIFVLRQKFDDAMTLYDEVLKVEPDNQDAKYAKAQVYLRRGEFSHGWIGYECRWTHLSAPAQPQFAQPEWDGRTDLSGKTILLYTEQGLGDTLQFSRYIEHVAARGATVLLEVQPELTSLMASLRSPVTLLERGSGLPLPAFDFQRALLSLPLAFGTELDSIPKAIPYINAPTARNQYWGQYFEQRVSPRIGIVWAGNPMHQNDHYRSISLETLSPLWENTGHHFFSLQKNVRAIDKPLLVNNPAITDLSAQLSDMAETAAIISNLDLIITVDTSLAHLAGALGKPVWILLPFLADFRWLIDRSDSPWYPTAKLFRQPARNDWSSAVKNIQRELATYHST